MRECNLRGHRVMSLGEVYHKLCLKALDQAEKRRVPALTEPIPVGVAKVMLRSDTAGYTRVSLRLTLYYGCGCSAT